MSDNWKHRSITMKCKSCMWFAPKSLSEIHDNIEAYTKATERAAFGRCRRHSPTLAGFPAVSGTDWCGDHKLDEASA